MKYTNGIFKIVSDELTMAKFFKKYDQKTNNKIQNTIKKMSGPGAIKLFFAE